MNKSPNETGENTRIPNVAPPNPVQREVLFRIKKGKVIYSYSDPGQPMLMIWNLVRQQLKAGMTLEIVCPDVQAASGLMAFLEATGLGPLIVSSKDTPELVRKKLTGRKRPATADVYDQLPWQQWKRRAVKAFQLGQQNLFGERAYRILGHEWFRAMETGRPEILEARLDPSLFQFTPQEFYLIRGRIKEAETLFNPQVLRLHALERLHSRFYLEMTAEEAETWLYDHLDEAIVRTRELLGRLHSILASYKKYLQTDRFSSYASFLEEIEKIRDRIEAASLEYGDELTQISAAGIQGKLKQSFSSRSKEIDQVRKQLKLAYMELHRSLESSAFAPYIVPFEDLSVNSISRLLDQQEEALMKNWAIILERAQESQVRLNSQNLEGNDEQKMVIRDLEKDIESWLKSLNGLHLFERPMDENALSLPKKGEILGHILEQLEETMSQLPRFIPFHEWRSFSLHLTLPLRKITALLGEEQNTDWLSSTEAWYYSQLLARFEHPVPQTKRNSDVPAWWRKKKAVELIDWMRSYAGIDPDGGWLTRLNEAGEQEQVVRWSDPEWPRLFPVHIALQDQSSTPPEGDQKGFRVLFSGNEAPRISQDRLSAFDLIIAKDTQFKDLTGFQRLFDPRAAWPDHRDVLRNLSADKIQGIRSFSEALIYEIAPARLFQTKDLLLLSKWPANLEQALIRRLGKNMKTEEIQQEEDALRLIEGLLDNDRGLYLLVEENVLSRIDPVWESMVLGWCEEAGMRILSLDWQEFWRNEHSWMDRMVADLKSSSRDEG